MGARVQAARVAVLVGMGEATGSGVLVGGMGVVVGVADGRSTETVTTSASGVGGVGSLVWQAVRPKTAVPNPKMHNKMAKVLNWI
ncbi:MAG: hypothetical protein H6657_21485 [Ardenticatenaceae bacterium]|nr:hypothetical protein [Ardenticatenaceae bacterium]